jgi:hypothetical protein
MAVDLLLHATGPLVCFFFFFERELGLFIEVMVLQ